MLSRKLLCCKGTTIVSRLRAMSQSVSYSAALSAKDQKKDLNKVTKKEGTSEQSHPNARSSPQKTAPPSSQVTSGSHSNSNGVQSTSGAYTATEYERASEHKSHTGQEEENFILTLAVSKRLHEKLTSIREKHFPKRINKLQAHITLFHALPGSQLPSIKGVLQTICQHHSPFQVSPKNAFKMKMGVGVNIGQGSDTIKRLQKKLKDEFMILGWLSEQDQGGFRAHVTVQNKVNDPEVVENSLREVETELQEFEETKNGPDDTASGLSLWRYQKGYWHFFQDFKFGGNESTPG